MSLNRRDALKQTLQASVAGLAAASFGGSLFAQTTTAKQPSKATTAAAPAAAAPAGPVGTQVYPFALPALGYEFAALAPTIDAKTMEIHHDKHHQTYITNLNNALKEHTALQSWTLNQLLAKIKDVPEAIRKTVQNNAGGHANHGMFWTILSNKPGTADGPLAKAIAAEWESVEKFQTGFNEAGAKLFGSGWVILASDKSGKLSLKSQPNQDSVIMDGLTPVIGNDVWEHAYYLTYQNKRADYLKEWWKVLSWDAAEKRYAAIKAGTEL
ncbi:MAG: superoxide dismutase [Pirellulales bacterium]